MPARPKSNRVCRQAKPKQIKVEYGRLDRHTNPSLCYHFGGEGALKFHTLNVMEAFEGMQLSCGKTLVQFLESEGFDIATLKMTVSKP